MNPADQQSYDLDSPGDVYQLKRMDDNEMARKPKPACPTCSAADKDKPNPKHKLSVTTYQGGPFTATKTMDLTDGTSYTGVGVALPPGIGMSQEVCVVQPFPGNSAADVITGTGATLSYNGEIAGPSASIGGNTSGVIGCVGVSTGVGGGWAAGGGYTW